MKRDLDTGWVFFSASDVDAFSRQFPGCDLPSKRIGFQFELGPSRRARRGDLIDCYGGGEDYHEHAQHVLASDAWDYLDDGTLPEWYGK